MATGKNSRRRARQAAVQALYQWQLTEQPPEQIESHFISDHELNGVDIEYFHHLVLEIPLHLHELDDHLQPYLERTIGEVDPVERAILRGVKRPQDCKLFGTVCTPENPIGSCMVSSEGACAAHYTYGRYKDVA